VRLTRPLPRCADGFSNAPSAGLRQTHPEAVERAKEVGVVGRSEVDRLRRTRFRRNQTANRKGNAGSHRPRRPLGTDPFINKPDGLGWLYVPTGLLDGPLPTQYEPAESPVHNPLYKQQSSPVLKYWKASGNPLAIVGRSEIPVRDDHVPPHGALPGRRHEPLAPVAGGAAARAVRGDRPELAQEKGIQNLDWGARLQPRSQVRAKALRHTPPSSASRWMAGPSHHVGNAVALGLVKARHRRHRQRADGAGRRSQRDDPRRKGVRLQHREAERGSECLNRWLLHDTTVCIGCKACEVACKQWNSCRAPTAARTR